MDEFNTEDDLKPDTSDRRSTRRRSASRSQAPRFAISRQHLMIAIGILVLVLLILGIGSALKAPTPQESSQQAGNAKEITLGGNPTENGSASSAAANAPASGQPQDISVPPIASTPTQAEPVQAPADQQRVDLPGNMTDALSQQQDQVNAASGGMVQGGSTLPTDPATLAPSSVAPAPQVAPAKPAATHSRPQSHAAAPQSAPAKSAPARSSSAASGGIVASGGAIQGAPASHYTLQLSSASRSDTLNAFARQQKLTHYQVYQTTRDGKPWYVLISGNYASSAEAKQAIARLPADVQAKKPWVKPVRQVQQDLKK